ncbi:hypothetical protein EGR_11210 [Echinococcus granulosus]|uniref:Uncharacterized protein n=1 Tax=Echinococcus granulosus TaxID=6210 RepID=W6TYZ7_ECHGR|nr:hypothetical protein EGR_11210 [Echinococcus granulosus]EUB53933.1 hypothetical protein EGR_11210 [Echinococcus granulosus]
MSKLMVEMVLQQLGPTVNFSVTKYTRLRSQLASNTFSSTNNHCRLAIETNS